MRRRIIRLKNKIVYYFRGEKKQQSPSVLYARHCDSTSTTLYYVQHQQGGNHLLQVIAYYLTYKLLNNYYCYRVGETKQNHMLL